MKKLFSLFSITMLLLSCKAKNNTNIESPNNTTNTLAVKLPFVDTIVQEDTLLFFVGKINNVSYALYAAKEINLLQLYVMNENRFMLKDSIVMDCDYANPEAKVQDLDRDGIVDVIYHIQDFSYIEKVYGIISVKLFPQPKLTALSPWLSNPTYLPKKNLITDEGYNRRNFLTSKGYYQIQNNALVLVKEENFKDPEDENEVIDDGNK